MGVSIAQGLANGIKNGENAVVAAAARLAAAAKQTIKDGLEIASPSKVAAYFGDMFGAGFAGGIEGQVDRVGRAADALARAAEEGAAASYGGGYTGYMTGPGGGLVIDYDALAEAVARGNESAGLGNAVIAMDKKIVGATTEPYSSRASLQRSQRTVKGRTSRMVLV